MEFEFVRREHTESGAEWLIYKLDRSLTLPQFYDEEPLSFNHVVVSAVVAADTGLPETYVFPANAAGEVINWAELAGSFRGALDHKAALDGFKRAVADGIYDGG